MSKVPLYSHIDSPNNQDTSFYIQYYMVYMVMTFVPCAIVSSQDNEVSCVCHCTSFKVVLLHFEPVTLARLIDTL